MNAQQQIERRILAQHLLVAERLRSDPQRVIQHARYNLQRWAGSYADSDKPSWMSDWKELLDGPMNKLLDILTSESERARQLRSSSPFAGIVTPRERWKIIKDTDRIFSCSA